MNGGTPRSGSFVRKRPMTMKVRGWAESAQPGTASARALRE